MIEICPKAGKKGFARTRTLLADSIKFFGFFPQNIWQIQKNVVSLQQNRSNRPTMVKSGFPIVIMVSSRQSSSLIPGDYPIEERVGKTKNYRTIIEELSKN